MIRRILIGTAILGVIGLTAFFGIPEALAQVRRAERGGAPAPGTGPVQAGYVRVIDSRSIETFINGQRVAIRLTGVEAPKDRPDCARQAVGMLEQLVKDGVELEDDPNLAFDDQGFRLYKAKTRDGRAIARELIDAGVVRPDGKGKDSQDLQNVQAQARGARRGCLWQ